MERSPKRPRRGLLARRISPRALRVAAFVSVAAILLAAGGGLLALRVLSRDLPSPARLQTIEPSIKTLVFSADGDTLHEYFRQNRVPVRLDDVPSGLLHAILDTEDRQFYDHYGINLRGIGRSVLVNLQTRRRAQGGSTLTQQLARSLFLTTQKSWTRKIREVLLALQIERSYTKDEILEMYVNTIYMGPAYGMEAAAQAYFGKSLSELAPAEYTLLAGVVNSPGYYSPFKHLDRAYERRNVVLRSMVAEGHLSEEDAEAISATPVVIRTDRSRERRAPYFVETIRQYLESNYGVKQLYEDGLRVYTTLDAGMQTAAEEYLEQHLLKMETEEEYPMTRALYDSLYAEAEEKPLPTYIQGALLAMDTRTGEVKAFVGGRDFESSKFNRVLQAPRQPGSVFKPFLYTAALQRGWHPGSVLLDTPVEVNTGSDELYRPVNFDDTFRGPVSLRTALSQSINVPAVRLILEVGTQPVLEMARRMGVESPIPDVYSIALGAGEAKLSELVSAYTVFANHGIRTRPMYFTRITNARGEVLEENRTYQEEVLDERTNYVMVDMMRTAIREGTGRSARAYGWNRESAGKTGTTDQYTDAWFVGFTPDMVCGVWVGFDTPQSMGKRKTGAVMALPIWARTMTRIMADRPELHFDRPEGIVERLICEDSGQRPAAACPRVRMEMFVEGMEPTRICELHQPVAGDVRDQAGDFEFLDDEATRNDEFEGQKPPERQRP